MLPDNHSLVHETIRVYKRPISQRHSTGLSAPAQGRTQEGGSTASGVRTGRRGGYVSPWLPWSAPMDRPWRASTQPASPPNNAAPAGSSAAIPSRRKRRRGGRKHKKAEAGTRDAASSEDTGGIRRDSESVGDNEEPTPSDPSSTGQHRSDGSPATRIPAALSPKTIFIDLTSTDSEDEEPPRGPPTSALAWEGPFPRGAIKGEPEKPPATPSINRDSGGRDITIPLGGINQDGVTAAESTATSFQDPIAGTQPHREGEGAGRINNQGIGRAYTGGACAYPEDPPATSTPRLGSGGSQGSGATSRTTSAASMAHHSVQVETRDNSSCADTSVEEPAEVVIRQDSEQIKRLIADLSTKLKECRNQCTPHQSRELLHFNTSVGPRRFPLSGPPAWPGIRDNPRVKQRRLERASALEKEATRLRESVSPDTACLSIHQRLGNRQQQLQEHSPLLRATAVARNKEEYTKNR